MEPDPVSDDVHKAFTLTMRVLLLYLLGSSTALLLLNWLLLTGGESVMAILPMMFYHAFTLLLVLKARRSHSDTLSTRAVLSVIVDTSLIIVSEILLLIVSAVDGPIVCAGIPLHCSVLLILFANKTRTTYTGVKVLGSLRKIMKLVQGFTLFLISLKLDGYLPLDWTVTLFPFLFFGAIAGCFAAFAGGACFTAIHHQQGAEQIQQRLWLFLVLLYVAVVGLGMQPVLVYFYSSGDATYFAGFNLFLVLLSLGIGINSVISRHYLEYCLFRKLFAKSYDVLPNYGVPNTFVKVPRSLDFITRESENCYKKNERAIDKKKTIASFATIDFSPSSDEIENSKCHVCFTSQPNAVFEACLHGGICKVCIAESIKTTQSCTICRAPNLSYFKLGKVRGNQVSVKSQYKYIRRHSALH